MGKRILVTGIAGFVGFHLAMALKARGDFVIGLDNFNSYYDPLLKRKRAEILSSQEITVICGDLCNGSLLKHLFLDHGITHVAHLAAQAGVRHSLSAPNDYVASNLQGFVSLLEACRSFPFLKIVYASSSSVYGNNQKLPFSVEDRTDQPTNLYGATKKANEAIAYAYHHLYGLSLTALRYFTVYGPFGRPDMAYYRFTHQIAQNHPIELFNGGKMRRDFTYIDDIVQGTMAAIDLGATYETFNLGGSHPIELMDLIRIIEKNLGKEAKLKLLPMQPGEIEETYADIEKSQKLLGFQPTVSLEEGMTRFISWYQEYHETLRAETQLNRAQ